MTDEAYLLREKAQAWRQPMGLPAEEERRKHLPSSTCINTLASIDNLAQSREEEEESRI
jgi:hypothetical protein